MKNKFSFRFQPILDIKERLEEDKKSQLGTATQSFNEEKIRLQAYIEKKDSTNDELNKLTQNVVTIRELQNYGNKLQYIKRQIDQQNAVVKNCEENMNNCRVELIEAKKQTMIFDKLKEKAFEQFNYLKLKEEELFIDQIVSFKSASK